MQSDRESFAAAPYDLAEVKSAMAFFASLHEQLAHPTHHRPHPDHH